MQYVATTLREKHSEDKIHILIPKTNAGNNTYDGIELGGERVTHEVETFLRDLDAKGTHVKKISLVGYSLGGLVARYAAGLLYSRGWFEKLEPVNFTTFASPALGARSPYVGMGSRFWNFIGSNTLSVSGQQLFLTDNFRDSGRPLLSILADPTSIFMTALSKFKNRVLYANIVNDRSSPYFTTDLATSDPFVDLNAVKLNYLPEYAPNILDPQEPVSAKPFEEESPSFVERLKDSGSAILKDAPFITFFAVVLPIASTVFLANSGIQAVRSQQRIKLHEEGKTGISLGSYRLPFLIENAKGAMEGAIEKLGPKRTITADNANQEIASESAPSEEDYIDVKKTISGDTSTNPSSHTSSSSSTVSPKYFRKTLKQIPHLHRPGHQGRRFALSPEQMSMIESLDDLGFKKYRVHITKVRHSHAAIIVRIPSRTAFQEGKVVLRHWLDEEFEI